MPSEILRPAELHDGRSSGRNTADSLFRRLPRLDFPTSGPQRFRLFCFPYAGGGPSAFQDWPPLLPAGCDVWAAHLPGRESRWNEECFTRIEPLIEHLAHAILPLLDAPCAFFGHSMGALVAFELARYLGCHAGFEPAHLFVSAARAPQRPRRERPLHTLPDNQFLSEVREFRGIPDEILRNDEFLELIVPTLRADFSVYENYRHWPGPPLNCPISAFAGEADSRVSYTDLAEWRWQTKNRFEVRTFSGGHFFIQTARGALLQTLAGILSSTVEATHA